mmetsp:Transcript_7612/g.8059  ORF Transcript_7612/g.8059 Transcript_7612/m.8059 type:complete len:345 (+) Transcript_7612:82-1116(+)
MDFSHVGGHCEMEGCNQQDFLPFKCNLCSKNLCLLHRSTVAHSCVSAGNNNVISIPCPICGKSIKMNQSDDANIEWERHFSTSCEQKSSSSSSSTNHPLKCASPSCNTILGPSNQIKCNTCNRQVCISHRAPDSHKCKEYQRANMLQSQSRANYNTPKNQNTNLKTTSTNQKTNNNNNNKKKSNEVDTSNTLRGTVARRQQNSTTTTTTTTAAAAPLPPPPPYSTTTSTNSQNNNETIEPCPICGEVFNSLQLLTSHLDALHLSPSSSVSSSSSLSPSQRVSSSELQQNSTNQDRQNNDSLTGREVCPQCSKRFNDIVELIQHVEKDHSSGSINKSNGDGCGLC